MMSFKRTVFIFAGLLCLSPWIGPPLALLMGIVVAIILGKVFEKNTVHKITSWLLKASVVGLGFGMDFFASIEVGKKGMFFTVLSIVSTFVLGYLLARKLSINKKIVVLISSGTAICGGSAIAAMTPVVDATNKQASVALGTVFILNSLALFLFPFLGHVIDLNQSQFGYWAAIAIHDTSSVVGAAATYGTEALSIATSVKLGRALWILPLTFAASLIYKSKNKQVSFPYFILLFIAGMLLNTFVPLVSALSQWIVPAAEKGLTLTLFLIGTGLSMDEVREVGSRPLITAILLWIFITAGSLWMVTAF